MDGWMLYIRPLNRFTGDSESPVGVYVSVFLCVSPVMMNCVPRLLPNVSCDWLQPPCDIDADKRLWKIDGWMNVLPRSQMNLYVL